MNRMNRQVMENLARANEVRTWIAKQRAAVKAGDIELWCSLCQSQDERLKSVGILDFLQWLPRTGERRARKIINDAFTWPTERTQTRRVDQIDLATALRLCHEVQEFYPSWKLAAAA